MWVVPGRWPSLTLILKTKLFLQYVCCVVQHLHESTCCRGTSCWEGVQSLCVREETFLHMNLESSACNFHPPRTSYMCGVQWKRKIGGSLLKNYLESQNSESRASKWITKFGTLLGVVPHLTPQVAWPWSWFCPLVSVLFQIKFLFVFEPCSYSSMVSKSKGLCSLQTAEVVTRGECGSIAS